MNADVEFLKDSYTTSEILSAEKYINSAIQKNKKVAVFDAKLNKCILIVLIGIRDIYGFYEDYLTLISLNEKYLDFLDRPSESNSAKIEKTKNKLMKEINDYRKYIYQKIKKSKVLDKFKNVSESLAINSFYPELISINRMNENLVLYDAIEISKHRNDIFKDSNVLGYSHLAVSPPTNSESYRIIKDNVVNEMSLSSILHTNSDTIWNRYIDEVSTPTSHDWGFSLIALGLHPLYKLEHSTNSDFGTAKIFEDLFGENEANNYKKNMELIKKNDFIKVNYKSDYPETNEAAKSLKQIMEEKIVIAKHLQLDSPYNPKVFTLLRFIADKKKGEIYKLASLTGLTIETLLRYESGIRTPKPIQWVLILLALDLHPYYKIRIRQEDSESTEIYKLYRLIHKNLSKKNDGFFLRAEFDYVDYLYILKNKAIMSF